LEVDRKSHPAWTGGNKQLQDVGQLSRFNKRFANISIGKNPE